MPGIKVGDAVIELFVNLASLDELESRMGTLPSKAASASTSVAGSLDGIAKSAAGAGNQATIAGEKLASAGKVGASGLNASTEATQQLQARIKQLEVELAVLQEKFGQTGHKASSSMHEARGTLALLGEDVGIRLPRHLQSFVAGIPGVSTALAAGFAPIAVITLIDVLDKIPEKIAEIEDWLAGFKKAQKEAFAGQETTFVSQLKTGIELLKEETLQQRAAGKAGIDATKAQIEGLGDYQHELTIAQENLTRFQKALDDVNKTTVIKPAEVIGHGRGGIPILSDPQIEKTGKEELKRQYTELVQYADSLAKQFRIVMPTPTINLEASDKSVAEQLTKFNKDISDSLTEFANKQAQSRQEQTKLSDEAQKQSLENQATALKSGLDVQLSTLDRFKENVRTAYLSGKADSIDWALAQVKATQEATKAHEDYLVKLEAVYRKAGDSAKVQETAEQLRVFQAQAAAKAVGLMNDSIQKETDGISKLKGELADAQVAGFAKNLQQAATAAAVLSDAQEKLIKAEQELATARAHGDLKEQTSAQAHLTEVTLEGDAAVKKATKDFEDAGKAAQALANAQNHLDDSAQKVAEAERRIKELQLAVGFREQEQAIERLAKFAVISEEEKERRLRKLYEDERIAAISEIDKELQQRQKKLDEAQANFNEAKNNPIFSEAQKKEAEANLNDALAAYEHLASEKVKIDDEFKSKQSGLNLVIRQGIQNELQLSQARERDLQSSLRLAKERGDEIKGIERLIAEEKKHEQQLRREAAAADLVYQHFRSDFVRIGPILNTFQQTLALTGDKTQALAYATGAAISSITEAYAQGAESISASVAKIAQAELQGIASIADAEGTKELAKALGSYPDFAGMAHHFASATLWFSLGGVIAAASGALGGIGSSDASTGGVATGDGGPAAGSTAASAAPQPIQVRNDQHFARGAVVTKKMRAVIGDGPDGGDADEAIIPLDDERATRRIAGAFLTAVVASHPSVNAVDRARIIARAPQLSDELSNPQIFTLATRRAAAQAVESHRVESEKAQSRQHSTIVYETHENHYHTHIKGDLVDYKQVAAKVSKPLSDGVKSGKFRLTSSTAFRQTKRG